MYRLQGRQANTLTKACRLRELFVGEFHTITLIRIQAKVA
jgi:hypothetical protein